MLIRVERGKGGRYRNAMLSPDLLTLLRTWWLEGRRQGAMFPGGWLFPGQNPLKPISTRQLARADESVGQPRTIDQGHGGAAGHRGDGHQGQEDARRAAPAPSSAAASIGPKIAPSRPTATETPTPAPRIDSP